MFANQFPHFLEGRILKREMLENLRDYPRNFLDLYFRHYSDGIIAGTNIVVEENNLVITKGIIKAQGRLYFLCQDYILPYVANEKETVLKIRFLEQRDVIDFTSYDTEIFLDTYLAIGNNELELARFKLKSGSKLRAKHDNFQDLATEFNTIIYIHSPYAGIAKSTLHPVILQTFAKELLNFQPSNIYDVSFAYQCLNQDRVQREAILFYLSNRLEMAYQDYTNEQIYKFLNRILLDVRGGKRSKANTLGRRERLIVD